MSGSSTNIESLRKQLSMNITVFSTPNVPYPTLPLPAPTNRTSETQHLSNISSEMPDCWDFQEFYFFFLPFLTFRQIESERGSDSSPDCPAPL